MSVQDVLRETAKRFVQEAHDRELKAKEDYDRIEAQLREARLEYSSAADLVSGATERVANFVPILGGNFQCPGCWVLYNKRSPLRPLPDDKFDCAVCGQEYFT